MFVQKPPFHLYPRVVQARVRDTGHDCQPATIVTEIYTLCDFPSAHCKYNGAPPRCECFFVRFHCIIHFACTARLHDNGSILVQHPPHCATIVGLPSLHAGIELSIGGEKHKGSIWTYSARQLGYAATEVSEVGGVRSSREGAAETNTTRATA